MYWTTHQLVNTQFRSPNFSKIDVDRQSFSVSSSQSKILNWNTIVKSALPQNKALDCEVVNCLHISLPYMLLSKQLKYIMQLLSFELLVTIGTIEIHCTSKVPELELTCNCTWEYANCMIVIYPFDVKASVPWRKERYENTLTKWVKQWKLNCVKSAVNETISEE